MNDLETTPQEAIMFLDILLRNEDNNLIDCNIAKAKRLADLFSGDVTIQHKFGVLMRIHGNYEIARMYFERALFILPSFHYSEIELGDVYMKLEDAENASKYYQAAIASAPDYPVGYFRAALAERARGRLNIGLEFLQELHRRQPENVQCETLRAEFLTAQNNRADAILIYERLISTQRAEPVVYYLYFRLLAEKGRYQEIIATGRDLEDSDDLQLRQYSRMFVGLAKLATDVNVERLIGGARSREASDKWLAAEAVLERLKSAIASQRPLSLLRLGDGEARFAVFNRVGTRNVIREAEAQAIMAAHWDNWFGQSFESEDPNHISALRDEFYAAIAEADILGIPTSERLSLDFLHLGYLNVLEEMVNEISSSNSSQVFTSAFIHEELHKRSSFYNELLFGLDFLGVISPHPLLAAKLARHHQIKEYRQFVIPGESRLPDSAQGRSGVPHFPQRYREMITQIEVPYQGAVFLVAGGLLGKMYCQRIKQLGGIALDIGAVADAWMGFRTRPGQFEPHEEWVLV